MGEKRFLFGIIVSVLWLVLGGVMLRCYGFPSDLNLWGDFFSGFFAPLAFLWLVIGYLQQGEELKQSTKALELQADELRESVTQQRELVEVTRQQVEDDRRALEEERQARQNLARPIFVASFRGNKSAVSVIPGSKRQHGTKYIFNVTNAGSRASGVYIAFDPEIHLPKSYSRPLVESGADFDLELDFGPSDRGATDISITYTDSAGFRGEARFSVVVSDDGVEFSHIIRVT